MRGLVDAAGWGLSATPRVPETAPLKTRLSVNAGTEGRDRLPAACPQPAHTSTTRTRIETARMAGVAKAPRLIFRPLVGARSLSLLHHPTVAVRVAEREERG